MLNTHWHADHTGGDENLANQGSVVVAHDNVRLRTNSEQFSKFFQSKAVVERLLELADDKTRIMPGHGDVADRAGLVAYREMLAVTSQRVRDQVKAGKTIDELLAAKPNADYDATRSWAFITADRYLQILVRDATESAKLN